MIELWKQEKDCTGCAACAQICPKQAIEMRENEKGFVFPYIDGTHCIKCGLCVKICPMKKAEKKLSNSPQAFALQHKDPYVLEQSSSGGAVTAIAETFAQGEFVGFGASSDEQLQVTHKSIKSLTQLDQLRKSKYVQSNTGDTFREVRSCLQKGIKVLYVGTPCQIAGLKAFLGREEELLLTCDLICEGVQSQRLFDQYVDYMGKKYKTPIKKVEFRNKEKYGWERSCLVLELENGKRYSSICHTKDNEYMNSCLFQGGNRDSCYSCKFNRIPRQGDFTLGDLWGWDKIVPQWNDKKGISLVLANSKKASDMILKIQKNAFLLPISFDAAVQKNPNIMRSTVAPPRREEYIADLERLEFAMLAQKWLKPRSTFRKCLSQIKYMIRRNKLIGK